MKHILRLLPRLADFELPVERTAHDVWLGDQQMFEQWELGQRPDLSVFVASNAAHDDIAPDISTPDVIGVAAVSLRNDLISGNPSAHLEVLVIDKSAEGKGLGKQLLQLVENHATQSGASNLTLTVFANNKRARKLYEQSGLEAETMRYNKWLG